MKSPVLPWSDAYQVVVGMERGVFGRLGVQHAPVHHAEQGRVLARAGDATRRARAVRAGTTPGSLTSLRTPLEIYRREMNERGLERFIRREPLRRMQECAFGVLALESEPVDPRL